ncbi:hypothetical protein P1X14_01005 [Sphingomonas sp. AOB5]|uniref:hypothetical protein n=1 Tax=Sphingomonas sp. AOB5 TaxID=3034017 RepID=UPI0023F74075|nr:hypothetical protein [Sphingomonas sp. AOB5]MDF7773811.1 hypothetical protein [Sphingomonas sp. AOB5]
MKPVLAFAALTLATPALAQTPAIVPMPTPAPVPAFTAPPAESPADAEAIRIAEERGKLIYAYDQAAWHGTDDFLAKVKDPAAIAGGYIADGPVDAPRLTFFSKDRTNPQAVYVAQFRGNRLVSSKVLGEKDDRRLSPQLVSMIRARETAGEAWRTAPGSFACVRDKPMNTVVLPPATPGGPMLVYLLTPQTEMAKLPFGGHFRVEIGPDGKPGAIRGFTRSCLTVPIPGPRQPVTSIGVAHLLDPVPTEIHVFSSLAAKKPLIVVIENPEKRYYSVENGEINRMSNDKFKPENGF